MSIALGVQACRRAQRVAFATAHEWVNRLGAAKRSGLLDDELERLGRVPLPSLILSSNKTFSAWAEIFGDPVAVAAMVDRLVHHAEVIVLKGDSYRLKGQGERRS